MESEDARGANERATKAVMPILFENAMDLRAGPCFMTSVRQLSAD